MNREEEIKKIDARLAELPKGTLTYKKINGKSQPYLQRTEGGKNISVYIKVGERAQILAEIEERQDLIAQKKRLITYADSLYKILQDNPYLANKGIGIGWQEFKVFTERNMFYVDKTYFIKQWWESNTQISLIIRPRRFGKTLTLSMVEQFFSTNYSGRGDLFEPFKIWKEKEYRELQGTIPVVFISFLAAKGHTFQRAFRGITDGLYDAYVTHSYLAESEQLTDRERKDFEDTRWGLNDGNDRLVTGALEKICYYLYKHHKQKPIILLDEYDTPVLEAYSGDYFDEMMDFYRQLINSSFKKNRYIHKAIVTGTTKVAKNSLFSDMNNVGVFSQTNNMYADVFGFTENEVMDALRCQECDEAEKVKYWYDGFTFGDIMDIYNPWSITNYLNQRQFRPYWISSSSNDIIGKLVRGSSKEFKCDMERLLKGDSVHKVIDEDISFNYMEAKDDTLWSLLFSTGYIKAENAVTEDTIEADFSITNHETRVMFQTQMKSMFVGGISQYGRFVELLLSHNIEELNEILNEILIASVSFFDAPENFYHGLVLGLIASLRDEYLITSNRESGLGRYDITMVPFDKSKDAFIMEFKVWNAKKEVNLDETARFALKQIEDKNYEAGILAQGFARENIIKLGFAFTMKQAIVMMEQ